jgi:tetratricopeptide (TPR) repeat protein
MRYLRISHQDTVCGKDRSHRGNFRWIAFVTAWISVLVSVLVCPLSDWGMPHAQAGKAQGAGSRVDWQSILDSTRKNPKKTLDSHLMLAVSYANLGMIPEATGEFQAIEAAGYDEFGKEVIRESSARVKNSPDDIVSLNLLAFAYYAFCDYPQSVRCFESLATLDPMNVWVHHYYAYSLSRVDRMDEAVDVLKASLDIDPSNEYTHLLLGLAYREKGWYLLSVLELARARKAISALSGLVD